MGPFGRNSLVKQFIYLISIMMSILLLSFVISNYIAQRIVEKKVTESVQKIMLQVEETIMSFYKDMDGISYSLLYNPTIQSYLSTNDILSRILMNKDIVLQFSSTLSLKENIVGIQLYDDQEKLAVSLGRTMAPAEKRRVEAIEYATLNTADMEGSFYTISVPVFNLQNNLVLRDYRGMCLFIMNVSNFSSILQKSKVSAHSRLLLIDKDNRIMTGSGPLDSAQSLDLDAFAQNKSYIMQEIVLEHTGWKIISIVPKAEVVEELGIVKKLNVTTYLIIFTIFCVFLLHFYNRLLKPVKALLDFVKSFAKSGGSRRFSVVYHNEIGVLASSLNQMLDDISTLSSGMQAVQKKMYETELAKKQMEISVYRNQINPHFLYNTLECIRAIAIYHKAHDIVKITSSLSNIFRYSLRGASFVSLQEEISHLQEYAKIIDYRFTGKIRIMIDAEEALLSGKTPQLLLQPIVENAVFHGLEKKIEPGTVQVRIAAADHKRLAFVISDDGIGIGHGQLMELRQRLARYDSQDHWRQGNKGIGLYNIHRRIKLIYGDQAELAIQSQINQGTTVTIILPRELPQAE